MTGASTDTRTIIVERDLPHPPEKIWRALTQSHLISEWLMETDFEPELGHRFNFSADWGEVACEVRTVKEHITLEYSWDTGDLRSVVTWTLTPTDQGTRLRMEQAGFRMDQPNYYGGAKIGWPRFLDNMEQILATLH